jgi:hypothetical protein
MARQRSPGQQEICFVSFPLARRSEFFAGVQFVYWASRLRLAVLAHLFTQGFEYVECSKRRRFFYALEFWRGWDVGVRSLSLLKDLPAVL